MEVGNHGDAERKANLRGGVDARSQSTQIMQFLHDEYGVNVSQIDLVSLQSNASSSMPYLTKISNKLRFWMFHVDSVLGQKMNKKI